MRKSAADNAGRVEAAAMMFTGRDGAGHSGVKRRSCKASSGPFPYTELEVLVQLLDEIRQ